VKCNQWRQLSGLCRLRYSYAPGSVLDNSSITSPTPSSRRAASARNFLAVTASTRNRNVLALARLRRVMLRIVPFRVAHRLYDRVGLFGLSEKLVLWMIVRKNV
jgi:hypothetical protein